MVPPHLEGHIEYHLEDYRIHAAKNPAVYDRVVSIGMFEHVGRSQFEIYCPRPSTVLAEIGRPCGCAQHRIRTLLLRLTHGSRSTSSPADTFHASKTWHVPRGLPV